MSGALPKVYPVRHGETAWAGRIRAGGGNVLLFAHREILRILAVRWIGLAPMEARCLMLATGSLSVPGYDHDLAEAVIHAWNGRDATVAFAECMESSREDASG